MRELTYPVLKYTPNFIRGNMVSPKDFLVVSDSKLKQGCFAEAIIFDSSGYRYEVLSAKKLKNAYGIDSLFYLSFIFKEKQTVWVDLELSEPKKMNIDAIRKELLTLLLENPSWYRNTHETKQSITTMLNQARTVKELIECISIYN